MHVIILGSGDCVSTAKGMSQLSCMYTSAAERISFHKYNS